LDLLGTAIVRDQLGVDLIAVVAPCSHPETDPGRTWLAHRPPETARLPSVACICP
jgi:hypothetical protein